MQHTTELKIKLDAHPTSKSKIWYTSMPTLRDIITVECLLLEARWCVERVPFALTGCSVMGRFTLNKVNSPALIHTVTSLLGHYEFPLNLSTRF